MAVALSALLLPVFSRSALAVWPSIEDYGSSGGSGPVGGIGDEQHPVTEPLSFVTDSLIPIPGTNTTVRRSVVVDATENGAQQEMLGFGSAWTDSAVEVFDELEEPLRRQVMNDLFGQDGNNQGFMRHTIGSSDLSYHQYSYDDNGPGFNQGQPDPTLANFGLGPYGTRMAEYTAMMGDIKGDVFLFGAPWSLPGWMKNNGLFVAPTVSDYSTSTHFLWNNSLNPEYIPSAIQYFARYVDAFKEKGVTIDGVSAQNEPLNYIGGTTTMYLDAVDEANMLLRGLGGLMHQRDVKFMAYDHNTDQPVYPARVLQGAGTDNVDAIAWHCYQGPVADYAVLDDLHLFSPKTVQFMTECSNTGATAGSTNYWVAQNFIPAVQHGASGASMWVMATNENFGPRSPYGGCETCLPSIFVNSSSHYEKTIDYYMIGHFSRFICRGAINHQVVSGNTGTGTSWSSQFWILAERNPDGGWAVVMMNNNPDDQLVTLSFIGSLNVWEGTVPAETVVTWMLPSDARVASNSSLASGSDAPYSLTNGSSKASPTGSGSASLPSGATGVSSDSTCVASTATTSSGSSSSGTNLAVPNTDQIIITAGPGPTGASGGSDEGVCPTAPQATVTVSAPYGGDHDAQGAGHGPGEEAGNPWEHDHSPNEQAGSHEEHSHGPPDQVGDHNDHGQGPGKHGGHGRHGGHRHGWGRGSPHH
ncbi:hypothetical protein KC367_g5648 [Hortaea werneckii]|nr:hypothetical protein KC367_g5648 [Hortaea werneckii]